MAKRMILLAMTFAALAALGGPETAGAAELVFTQGGARVSVGEEITGTSSEGEVFNPLVTETETLGFLSCEKIMLGGTLEVNNGTTISGSGVSGQSSATICGFERGTKFAVKANVTAIFMDDFSSTSAETGTGTFEATFIAEIPGGPLCHLETVEPGVFHYPAGGGNLVTVTPTALEGGACGESSISGEVLLDVHRAGKTPETLAAELR